MKLFSSKVTRLTVVGPLALVYIALHRADYSMAALWFCIASVMGRSCFLSNDTSEI